MREKSLFVVILVTAGVIAAQDRSPLETPHKVPPAIAAEAQVHVDHAYALYRDHQSDDALREAHEALSLDPSNTAASSLVTMLSLSLRGRSSKLTESLAQEDNAQPNINPGDIVLPTDRPILLRLIGTVTSSPSDGANFGVQVVHDVTVNGTVVIKKQTPVKFSIERQPAGNLTEPGVLTVSFDSVVSSSGDEIRLEGSESAAGSGGKVTCVERDCLLLPLTEAFALARKGHEGAIRQGLLTTVRTKGDYILRADRVAQGPAAIVLPPKTANRGDARVHFYFNDIEPNKVASQLPSFYWHKGLTVRVDGTEIGVLPSWHYACTTIKPGVHDVKIGKTMLRLFVDAGRDYFVKAETNTNGFSVEDAEDYTIDAQPLSPSSFKKDFKVDCWE